MNPEDLPDGLFDLLGKGSFKKLSLDEQALILRNMDEQAFDEMQHVVASFKEIDANMIAEVQSPAKVQPLAKAGIFSMQIPLWQAACLMLLCLGLGRLLASSSEPESKVQYVETSQSLDKEAYPEELIFEL